MFGVKQVVSSPDVNIDTIKRSGRDLRAYSFRKIQALSVVQVEVENTLRDLSELCNKKIYIRTISVYFDDFTVKWKPR